MSTVEMQIAERARKYRQEPLTNLHQFIDLKMLGESLAKLNKKSSPGVDGTSWSEYDNISEERLPGLMAEFKSGKYRAPHIRRAYIPKGKDGKRALGIPTIEDKVLQSVVSRVLSPIYEIEFKTFSYGFQTGRSCHQAIDYMYRQISYEGLYYIIDADIHDYFGSINHELLREFLGQRVNDGVIRRMIDKWLKAGILEDGQLHYPEEGTPQGGIISPLLSNIYLHYVLDVWFSEKVQPLLTGKSFIVRYADDFVLGFENITEAQRVMRVLPKRFEKYKLQLHPEKTKLIDLKSKRGMGGRSFDFLGFTHFLSESRNGKKVLKRKTSRKKLTVSLQKTQAWIKANRHMRLKTLIKELNVKLRGYYNYYGITFNSKGIAKYYYRVVRYLQKWLNRRGGKSIWTWDRFYELITIWLPLLKPRIYHSY
jgi:RNA-directed DNA polymerase